MKKTHQLKPHPKMPGIFRVALTGASLATALAWGVVVAHAETAITAEAETDTAARSEADSTATEEAAPSAVFNRPTYSSPITLSADNRLVWSVNPSDDTVSVIRADTNRVIATIPVGDEPQSVALTPDNTFAYVANAASSDVTVIKILNANPTGFRWIFWRKLITGAEPWNIVASPDGKRIFVANSSQDTITVIASATQQIIGHVNLRNSVCNAPYRDRHFQPRGLAVTQDNTKLYVTRFLSFVKAGAGGKQGIDKGKEGLVCRLNINTSSGVLAGYQPWGTIPLAARLTGFKADTNGDKVPDADTFAFPNQLQSIVIHGNTAYLPNIAASASGPLKFDVDTHAFVNVINGVNGTTQTDGGALNLHLGARNPEAGKQKLFFANPWAIAFTTPSGAGKAYAVSAGSDLLVKLNVAADGALAFTVDGDTTRYIDLNDPANPATAGDKAGKNPQGIAITNNGAKAYVMNFVSRNVSVVNLGTDKVVSVIRTAKLPLPGSSAEVVRAGAEMFFSSRGHFNDQPYGTTVSTNARLSQAGWQNCASCHFQGLTDGVIWTFNAGPRKSVSLNGTFNPRNRLDQRVLNYSAIFDEVEDFELNIRNVSGPGALATPVPCSDPAPGQPATSTFDPNHGLLVGDNGDINTPPCTVVAFNKPNANRQQLTITPPGSNREIPALTALKRWVQFAVRTPNAPLGVNPSWIAAGRTLFAQARCTTCHSGGKWTISTKNFQAPPLANQISTEKDPTPPPSPGAVNPPPNPNSAQYLFKFLRDIGSFNLNVGAGNRIPGQPLIGAIEKDQAGNDALGLDYDHDGKGAGFNVPSLLGIHAVQPYLHNGACETLACVVKDAHHRTAKGRFPDVIGNDPGKQFLVVKFLESIDAKTTPF